MAIVNGLDRTQHFAEFDDPLDSQEGVLSPATRKSRAVGNLLADGVEATFANSATSGNVEPLKITSTYTPGPSGTTTGGRIHFLSVFTGQMGSWSNALKAEVFYGSAGLTTGLGSAFVAELSLSAGCTEGTYAPLEAELVMPASADVGTETSFLYAAVSGAAAGAFDDDGGIVSINGVTIDTGHVIQASAVAGVDSTHAMRIFINGTAYYVPLHTSAGFA